MANSFFHSPKKITLPEQMFALRHAFAGAECYISGHKKLIWKGTLRPSELSNSYSVVLEYSLGHKPKVTVSGEGIKKLDDPDFPHIFHRNREKNEESSGKVYSYGPGDSAEKIAESLQDYLFPAGESK